MGGWDSINGDNDPADGQGHASFTEDGITTTSKHTFDC